MVQGCSPASGGSGGTLNGCWAALAAALMDDASITCAAQRMRCPDGAPARRPTLSLPLGCRRAHSARR